MIPPLPIPYPVVLVGSVSQEVLRLESMSNWQIIGAVVGGVLLFIVVWEGWRAWKESK